MCRRELRLLRDPRRHGRRVGDGARGPTGSRRRLLVRGDRAGAGPDVHRSRGVIPRRARQCRRNPRDANRLAALVLNAPRDLSPERARLLRELAAEAEVYCTHDDADEPIEVRIEATPGPCSTLAYELTVDN